jgi:uncharacterized OsmC-like protein
METKPTLINGYDVEGLRGKVERARRDPLVAERSPVATAHWMGRSRARVEVGKSVYFIGGDDEPSAMQALLGSLAACDVEVIALHAALLGIRLESLTIEAQGHFNIRAYYGIDAPGSGYDRISYVVKLRAPGLTAEQLQQLKERCERSSPVGDSLTRAIPLKLEFVAGP